VKSAERAEMKESRAWAGCIDSLRRGASLTQVDYLFSPKFPPTPLLFYLFSCTILPSLLHTQSFVTTTRYLPNSVA
jgi:hypothetical protein